MGLKNIGKDSGYACPRCGQDEELLVHGRAWVKMRCDDPAQGIKITQDDDWVWNDESTVICPKCAKAHTLGAFEHRPTKNEEDA